MDILPTWDECNKLVETNEATALQRFIYDNEPAGKVGADEFRTGLFKIIKALEN